MHPIWMDLQTWPTYDVLLTAWISPHRKHWNYQQWNDHSAGSDKTRPAPATKTQVNTRWNSSYDMTEWFLEQQPVINAPLLSTEVRKSGKHVFPLNEADIACAEEVLQAPKPMKDAILVMSQECKCHCTTLFQGHHGHRRKPEWYKDSKGHQGCYSARSWKRYANERETLFMASALDPSFKDLPFLSETKTYSKMTDVVVAAIKMKQNLSK